MFSRSEDQRTRSEREAVRVRQIELESITRQLNEIKKEVKPYGAYAESIEARKQEDARLSELIGRLQLQTVDLDRRVEQPGVAIAYLEEQRRQDAKRIAGVEQEIPDLKRRIESLPPQLLLLDEAVRRKQVDLEEAAKLLESQAQVLESQRVSDVNRERRFAEYVAAIEKYKDAAESIQQQVTGFVQMREEVRRILAEIPDFEQRLEVRINEIFEIQRDGEERTRRAAENFKDVMEKDWKVFTQAQEEKWHPRDKRISEYEPRIAELEEEIVKFQPQISPLYDIFEAFAKQYAAAGREWLAESNKLLDAAKTAVPSDVKLSRRQRKKQEAKRAEDTAPPQLAPPADEIFDDLVE
jgi:chromosome segregation ATPase